MGFIQQFRYDADYNFQWVASGSAAADPQLQFFENFSGHFLDNRRFGSNGTLSIQAINIPGNLSFNNVIILASNSNTQARTHRWSVGLYSLNGATLSLANSASASWNPGANANSWISMVTSATQNITPGTWYLGVNVQSSGNSSVSFAFGDRPTCNNANPILINGRMTVSTTAMPASIATSALDITGGQDLNQPLVIITA